MTGHDTISLDELKGMMGIHDAPGTSPCFASDAESEDIDAINDALEEVYATFLAQRTQLPESYLRLGTQRMVDNIRKCMSDVEGKYAAKRPAKRDDLIKLAICTLELLSLEHVAKEGE